VGRFPTRLEKQLRDIPARLTEAAAAAALHLYPVVQPLRTEHREHTAGGTTLEVQGTEDDPREARMNDGPGAHDTGLQRHV